MLAAARVRRKVGSIRLNVASMHSVYARPDDPVCSSRPPSTAIVAPVTKPALGEIEDRPGHVVWRADPSQRRLGRTPGLVVAGLERDRAGRDPADADLRRERLRQGAGQHRLRGLGRAVRREGRPGLVGGDVLEHDHEPTRLAEVRHGRLGDEEASLDGGAECAVDVLLGDLLEAARLEPGSGAVDDDVEAAELRRGACHERAGLVGPREVAVAAPGRDHLPPLAAKPFHDCRAELAGAAGEERALQRACSNRFATSSQLTTSHHAAR